MPERKLAYQALDNKMTPGFRLSAPSMERLFVDAGLTLTDIFVRQDLLEVKLRESLKLTAENPQDLMNLWLKTLLQLIATKGFLARRIVFEKFDGKNLTAVLHGETHERLRHGVVPDLKDKTHELLEMGQKTDPDPEFFVRVKLGI